MRCWRRLLRVGVIRFATLNRETETMEPTEEQKRKAEEAHARAHEEARKAMEPKGE